jgi:hypothetical protein
MNMRNVDDYLFGNITWRATPQNRCPACNSPYACYTLEYGPRHCWRTHNDIPGWSYLGDDSNGFGMIIKKTT